MTIEEAPPAGAEYGRRKSAYRPWGYDSQLRRLQAIIDWVVDHKPDPPAAETGLAALFRLPSARATCRARQRPVKRDSVIIGSYNFLSADPTGTTRRERELSVEVQEAELANTVWGGFEHLVAAATELL